MAHRSAAQLLAELRRSAPSRRRFSGSAEPVPALVELLALCRMVRVEEQPGSIIFRLRTSDEPPLQVACVVSHATSQPLTAAEAAVAEWLCQGRTVPQIARLRGVSTNTIKSQVRQIFRKLEVDSRVALVRRLSP